MAERKPINTTSPCLVAKAAWTTLGQIQNVSDQLAKKELPSTILFLAPCWKQCGI